MKRYLVMFAVLALLTLPLVAGAQSTKGMDCRVWDETGCMPSWWTPYPQASKSVDTAVKKGVITPQEAAQPTQPQVATPTGQSRGTARNPGASSLTTP